MSESRIILQPECSYHIYNHAVGNENIFEHDKHYQYFLTKLQQYCLPVSEVFTYCLLPNHFHLIVRMKNKNEIKDFLNKKYKDRLEGLIKKNENFINEALSKAFSNFFNTYAKHYNYPKKRHGALFKRAFRRNLINDIGYLRNLIIYIHQNPVGAGLADKPEHWKYSSYNAIISDSPTLIPREEIIRLFEDLENFKYCHLKMINMEME